MRTLLSVVSALLFLGRLAVAQERTTTDSTALHTLDTLSIFRLIDSLLALQEEDGARLAIRVGYNSNVISAGRTLGIENFGLSPGLSYYHPSGLFADISGFYSRAFDPDYYLTILSAGYLAGIGKNISLIASYDRYLYRLPSSDINVPFRNALSGSALFDSKLISGNLNYSFYFGDQNAHRISTGLNTVFEKKRWRGLDRIGFRPGLMLLWGNQPITSIIYKPPSSLREALQNLRRYGSRFQIVQETRDVFGLMNFALVLPASLWVNRWSFSVSYVYSVPRALEGELLTLDKSSFVSASVTYLLPLKPQKKALLN